MENKDSKSDCFLGGALVAFISIMTLAQIGRCVTEEPEAVVAPVSACPPAPPVHVDVSCAR